MDSCQGPPQKPGESWKLTWYFCVLVAANAGLQLAVQFHWLELASLKGWATLAALLLSCGSVGVLFGYKILVRSKVQISLKQAFCIMTAIAVPLAGLGREIQQASRQRESLARFRQNRGSWYRYRVDHEKLRTAANWPSKFLFDALGDDFFFDVEWLDISVTADGFQRLSDIRFLYGVNLRQCQIDDHTLVGLVRNQPYLKHLGIEGTPITDEGLRHLHAARNLEELWLSDTKVSAQGILSLQTSLPKCQIHHSL